MNGRLIAVVGPSGVGKDSVMAALAAALPNAQLVRRTITRAKDAGGEDYEAVTPAEFAARAAQGAFAVHWGAHGLSYGIPASVTGELARGATCLANFSRKALPAAAQAFPNLTILNITARPDTLAARLAARGRETPEEIAKRLAEADKPLPPDLPTLHLANDGPLADTVARALALLAPAPAA
ncbi:MAG: phosphonate metabolism protein/1,5-bisphosphokinase (PRPP-forming) PhnN [Pseudomonadota bacterium]